VHDTHVIKLVKTESNAVLPRQAEGDVGFDLCATRDVVLNSRRVTKVSTGLRLADDPGTFWLQPDMTQVGNNYHTGSVPLRSLLKIEGRSGLASKGVWPVGGIVDPSYRGELVVMLYNSNDDDFIVNSGDRIAQVVWYPVLASHPRYKFELVVEASNIEDSTRGDRGFGSTGR